MDITADKRSQIDLSRLPRHIAIIMDGNGRWAKQQGRMRVFGHQHGVESVRQATEAAAELGVQYLTLYAFSAENWKRPKAEVTALMKLLVNTIHNEIGTLNKNNIKLAAIGDLESLDKTVLINLQNAIDKTAQNNRMQLTLALSYSSRWEIVEASKKLARLVKEGLLDPEKINETLYNHYLNTHEIPDPELLIRTSGEFRISNFLLYQIAYSELYFTPKLWPDFRKDDLYEAIIDYQQRERRFGKISEQINKSK